MKNINQFYLDKQNHKSKWHLVLTTSFGLIASAYCLVLPHQMKNLGEIFNLDDQKEFLTLLTTLHYLLNSFLPYFSGVLRDSYGDTFAILFQNLLCVIGQFITTIGAHSGNKITFIIGRIIIGWGIESLLIVLTSFICSYYKFTYLTFVLGIYQLIYMSGMVVCTLFAPNIDSIYGSNVIALLFTILGLIMAFVTKDIDINVQSIIIQKGANYFQIEEGIKKSSQLYQKQGPSEIFSLQDDGEEIKIEQDYIEAQQIESEVLDQNFYENCCGYGNRHEFPIIYWLLLFFYTFASTSVLVLVGYAQEFLLNKWLINLQNGEDLARKLVTLMWLFSGFITPLLGFVIDMYGQRSTLTIFSGLMAIWAHILVLLQSPFEGLLLLGFSFALSYTTVWSSVLYLTHPHKYGRSLALFVCLQNFGISVTPHICTFFEILTDSKIVTESFLLLLALMATVASLLVYKEDKKYVNLIDRGLQVESEITSKIKSSKIQS
ncbi:unnamed protein product [Paramecium pentaurelia]|uniref:Major facilitator superfamily (MFS) profile domain-containing protein n=1 Tax=Paramecium pentaurelia TaxID=43138 RepID=A0A8S1SHW3_9CILI|nr:unnamed protein product [Paramecium pentaurelia]